MLVLTNPTQAGPVAILVVIILTYLSLLGVVTFLLFTGARLIRFLAHAIFNKKIRTTLSLRRAYLYATVLATLPMMAVGLNSMGGIQWYEILLLALFGGIGVIYIARRT
jgi:hypothetical protein